LVPPLQERRLPIEIAARDARVVDLGDDVHALLPEGADTPADECEREYRVEDPIRDGAVETAQLVQHGRPAKLTCPPLVCKHTRASRGAFHCCPYGFLIARRTNATHGVQLDSRTVLERSRDRPR